MNNDKRKLILMMLVATMLMFYIVTMIRINSSNNNPKEQIVPQACSDDEQIQLASVLVKYIDALNNNENAIKELVSAECRNDNLYDDEKLDNWKYKGCSIVKEKDMIKLYLLDYVYNDDGKQILVKVDENNQTFEIYTNEYLKTNDAESVKMQEIEYNGVNEFVFIKNDLYHRIIVYLQNYLMIAKANISSSTKLVDPDYYSTFSSEREYKQMVDMINEAMTSDKITDFYEEDSTIYFKIGKQADITIYENDFMDYTLILDSYRLKKEEYSNLTNEKKAESIANDFAEMIIMGDYAGVYNVLNETFKKNNFDSVESLKDTLTKELGTIDSYSIESSNDTVSKRYQYVISVKNDDCENRNIDLIIRLIDNENYEISFSIKE